MLTYLGKAVGQRESLDLAAACRQALPGLRDTLPKGIVLETELPDAGPVLMVNPNQLKQVLTHLVTNAWEAIGAGHGTVRLAVRTVAFSELPSIHLFPVDWQPQGVRYACLEESDLEKLFDPYYSTKFTGRGLGLPVVLGVVRSHGGAVAVDSKVGCGSTFRVYLPIPAETSGVSLPDVNLPATASAGGGTVLVVEDDALVLKMTAHMLERLGFKVLEAKDGQEAVEVFLKQRNVICCVLSDMTMPRMDGWKTLEAIRRIAPDFPFLLASGYDQEDVMTGDHAELPDACLCKPYALSELKEALAKALETR